MRKTVCSPKQWPSPSQRHKQKSSILFFSYVTFWGFSPLFPLYAPSRIPFLGIIVNLSAQLCKPAPVLSSFSKYVILPSYSACQCYRFHIFRSKSVTLNHRNSHPRKTIETATHAKPRKQPPAQSTGNIGTINTLKVYPFSTSLMHSLGSIISKSHV